MENKETKANEPINMVEYNNNYISTGLTKREYFAAMAMQGIIANKDGLDIKIERIVESAVDTADALIEELNKTK
jgi:nitrogenase subunit NifH